MKLLIVEDNEQMRCLIKCLVSDLAQQVFECSDGSQALAAYVQHQPDWVLMDIKMVHMDGIAATRQITAAYPDAQVIIVTDYNDVELRAAAREAGACEYVVKENLLDLGRILSPKESPTQSLMRTEPASPKKARPRGTGA
jgi:CheY-like chemotaxis protein